MCHLWTCVLWTIVAIMVNINADSSEEQQANTYTFYAPSSMGFSDIYNINNGQTSQTSTEEEVEVKTEPALTTTTTEDSTVLIKIPSHFVEFYPELTTLPPTTPPPKFILNSTYLNTSKKHVKSTTTTEEPDDDIIKVVPLNYKKIQRGVLDLIFPSARVKTFKNAFDSLRRLLSHTFRRR